jgi:hypothetical protein
MARLCVEGWAPEYGAAVEPDDALAPAEGAVEVDVEGRPWEPIPGRDDGVPVVAFVDGVRRIDARLVLDDPARGPIPGICASFGVGSVLWHREERRAEVVDPAVERLALLLHGRTAALPHPGHGLAYRAEAVEGDDPAGLVRALHGAMRRAEARLAERLAEAGCFVVADGPLYEYTPVPKVGYIKSHRRTYLPDDRAAIVGALGPGERTPLFTVGEGLYRRYSWYLRLARFPGGHSWTGIARGEAAAALGREQAAALADRTAAVLPLVGSEPHIDPRAPQNLVPVAALERHLRCLLGDAGLVLRALRAAALREEAA